jgi:hypothetical protein
VRWAGHEARMEVRRGAYSVLVGKPQVRRPLGRSRRKWEDNIKIYIHEVRWGGGGAWNGLIWLGVGAGGGHL